MDDLMALAQRYDVAAPRYTSYPTAVSFQPDVTPEALVAAIQRSNEAKAPASVELYIHLPFCHSLCYYCACNRIITRNADKVRRYMDGLVNEAAQLASHLGRNRAVRKIHLGGGTPTYLPPAALAELMERLAEVFAFAPINHREAAIEVDPRSVSANDMGALKAAGFTRLSFGVQDLDPKVQSAINRVQPYARLQELVGAVRREGFSSLNFDLIYGLPHQSVERFGQTLEQVLELAPDRIALYGYAHMPERFRAQRLLNGHNLPSGHMRLQILMRAIERLTAAGYIYIGMDHFARTGDALAVGRREQTLIRNFQGYEPGPHTDLIGLGMSAISALGDIYTQNHKLLPQWGAAADERRLTVERGYVLSRDDRVRRDVIEVIMCRDRLNFSEVEQRHAIDFEAYFAGALARLRELEADGLVQRDTHALHITPRGRLFLRAIAMCFDAYLKQPAQKARYSRIV
ncbi:oxygen-independent coproporphyrinogen III oxidase [Salinisphaera sp. SWV1]|uniref:oxygen-independent coproporphyrinogen III oxidase n=1 Tax=Salinisphaera sp. SWV1 TaxID=3454139 RepID=UPI003F84F650